MKMYKFAKLSATVSALTIGAALLTTGTVHAESAGKNQYKRNKAHGNVSIFGAISVESVAKNPFKALFGNKKRRKKAQPSPLQPATANNSGNSRPTKKRKVASIPKAPVAPYMSEEIYDYKTDRLVVLSASKLPAFDQAVADNTLAQTIYTTLKTGNSSVRVTKKQRAALIKFYQQRHFKPVWSSLDGIDARVAPVLRLFSNADYEGLDSQEYLPSEITSFSADLSPIETDVERLAKFDMAMTAMALRYAMQASGGRIVPDRLSGYHDLNPPVVDPKVALAKIADSPMIQDYLAGLNPQTAAYKQMRAALKEELTAENKDSFQPIDATGMIRPGENDPRIPAIRDRLSDLGFLDYNDTEETPSDEIELSVVANMANENLTYNKDLIAAIRVFQKKWRLSPDAVIGKKTFTALNKGRVSHKKKLVLNMERARWLPRNLGKRYIFVNQASFTLQMIDAKQEIWKTRVVVGKPRNQTSFFSDTMKTVVFNPYWGVPQSIIKHEMLARLYRDPSYLDRNGYEVIDRRGRKVSSSAVNWTQYSSKVPYDVRQLPGARNALGQVKFLFPNKHAIYLHDTPSRRLFSRSIRALSHGCVRVKEPRKLAELILGWKQAKINGLIDAKKNRQIRLKSPVPVHLTYFTAWPNANGKVEYFADVYSRDKNLTKAMGTAELAMQ